MLEKLNRIRLTFKSWVLQPNNTKKLGYLLLGVVTFILGSIGLFKVFGGEYSSQMYTQLGINDYYRIRIGLLEIIGVSLIWFNRTSSLGMYLIFCLMGGAVSTHILTSPIGMSIPIYIGLFTFVGVSIRKHGFNFKMWL